jgi:cobalt/nickel transport system permease protein
MSQLSGAAAGLNSMERLSRGDSPVHRLNTGAKCAAALIFLALTISFPSNNVSGLVPYLLYPALMMSISGTPCRPLIARLAFALPFSLFGGISNLFFMREAAFTIGGLTVSAGLVSFTSIMLKALLSVFAALILIATTPFNNICALLTKVRGLNIFGVQLSLSYRYISVLINEAQCMWTAYLLRAPAEKAVKMKDMGSFLGQLLLRSFSRAERVYSAMKCRGFCGVYHPTKRQPLRVTDIAFLLITAAALVILRFFNLSLLVGGIMKL